MGLFDSWRRKKKPTPEAVARPREVTKIVSSEAADTKDNQDSISSLLGRYEELVHRREMLQVERENLTRRLEAGELEATEFRKELMARIQEAAQVSDHLRLTTARLTQLGYRGALH